MKDTRPNFFIVGAAKCATTSLGYYLRQHPDIFIAKDGLAFYAPSVGINSGLEYLSYFDKVSNEKMIGENCNAYMTLQDSAKSIHNAIPDAKIIISLRNPAHRAFSLYNHMRSMGYEDIDTFVGALVGESMRAHKNDPYIANQLYFESGMYSEQIQKYLDVFDRKQIHFVLFEQIKDNALIVCREIFKFLEVDHYFNPTIEIKNPARRPRSQRLQYLIRNKLPMITESLGFKKGSFSKLANSIIAMNRAKPKSTISPDLHNHLMNAYATDIKKTSYLTGIDLKQYWR